MVIISIHAPPRGATMLFTLLLTSARISIHAPPRGATVLLDGHLAGCQISIHAPPRGATFRSPSGISRRTDFNSRPSARGDGSAYAALCALGYISIHAPPRGATQSPAGRLRHGTISIHAPPRGATAIIAKLMGAPDISIHAPPRGATGRFIRAPAVGVKFQFTPLREGRLADCILRVFEEIFQFTPLREGRLHAGTQQRTHTLNFNSRPSARGDRRGRLSGQRRGYFNSRPSARGDARWRGIWAGAMISIHAPPRGATALDYYKKNAEKFQFTPLREGRRVLPEIKTILANISIHAPPRGATSCSIAPLSRACISIHAPPRGATVLGCLLFTMCIDFNSRPSARGDSSRPADQHHQPFQFTPLREGRRFTPPKGFTPTTFQFTPLREGRLVGGKQFLVIHISIHAPPRGATRTACTFPTRQNISIHAPPRGATSVQPRDLLFVDISIHAPPRGATPTRLTKPSTTSNFNSRPSARGDRGFTRHALPDTYFNSRPSARGDAHPVRALQ